MNKTMKIFVISLSIFLILVGIIFWRIKSVESGANESVVEGCREWSKFVQEDIRSASYNHDSFGPLLMAKVQFEYAAQYGDSSEFSARSGIAKLVGEINQSAFEYDLKEITNFNSQTQTELENLYSEIVGNSMIVQSWCEVQ
jgi:hypothetical protein